VSPSRCYAVWRQHLGISSLVVFATQPRRPLLHQSDFDAPGCVPVEKGGAFVQNSTAIIAYLPSKSKAYLQICYGSCKVREHSILSLSKDAGLRRLVA
jgi:hypothetical protein